MYRVNQRGVFLGMQAVVPPLRRAGRGSSIKSASGAALRGMPGLVGYSATKFAVRGTTKVAAAELGARGIRVHAIHPGLIATPMLEENSEETMAVLRTMVPLGRLGTADDVAELAVFLASDASAYISGGDFQVDGAMVT